MNQDFIRKKASAFALRKQGKSFREINKRLGIPKSTLSGWFRGFVLTNQQLSALRSNWLAGLVKAREKAAEYHRLEKQKRLKKAFDAAEAVNFQLNCKDGNVLKLALAMLYAGEGHKKSGDTAMGNSDPRILRTFMSLIEQTYGLNKKKLRLYLHLRADQDFDKELMFWSNSLNIEAEYFAKIPQIDKRTIGSRTFDYYHGVCVVRYYDISIQRELLALSEQFFGRFG